MRLKIERVVIVGIKEQPSKDGSKMYYSLNVEQDGDVFQFPCDLEVARSVEKYKAYVLDLDYTKRFWDGRLIESMRIVGASPAD